MEIGGSCGDSVSLNDHVIGKQTKCEDNGDRQKIASAPNDAGGPIVKQQIRFHQIFKNTPLNMLTSRNGDFRRKLIQSMKPESRAEVDSLLDKIKQLSIIQKILLYAQLPPGRDDTDEVDPLPKKLNPLGNRPEVTQAISYIKTHFLPDPDISLPKKELYNEYAEFCLRRGLKPLSTADFGKVMKQVYPVVRPRRLGERGNSRYCYSGLCNRDQLIKPTAPRFPGSKAHDQISKNICGWASKILNVQVDNLTELSSIIPCDDSAPSGSDGIQDELKDDMQMANERQGLKVCKRKFEVENARSSASLAAKQKKSSSRKITKTQKPKCTKASRRSVDLRLQKGEVSVTEPVRRDISNTCDTFNQKQADISLEALQTHKNDLKTENSTNKGERKRLIGENALSRNSTGSNKSNDVIRLVKLQKGQSSAVGNLITPTETEDNFCIASIEDDPSPKLHFELKGISISLNNNLDALGVNMGFNAGNNIICTNTTILDKSDTQDCEQTDIYNDIGYLTSDSLGNYLQDEGNSQEPEEELLKYFKDPVNPGPKVKDVSQLRLLLEQDLPEVLSEKYNDKPSERDTGFCEEMPLENKETDVNDHSITILQKSLPQSAHKTSFSSLITGTNTRRRVSFEKVPDSFPQSPNNYRKNFSFTPISPRPPTIYKPITNSSPFVFPRETVFRGKHPPGSSFSIIQQQQQMTQSLMLHGSCQTNTHISPLKTARSTSLSSTPSPVTNGRLSASAVAGGSSVTPQETSRDQADSLISPSSSSGVFLSPASPISSCNSPVFTFRKSMSPVKQPEERPPPKPSSSLLQSLLLTGKCPEIESINGDGSRLMKINRNKLEPLVVNVLPCSHEDSFRSQSVPLPKSFAVSPSSNTHPFPISVSKNKEVPSLEGLKFEVEDLEIWDSVLNGPEDNLLLENGSDDTEESVIQTDGSKVSMESVMSSVYELLSDKGVTETNENIQPTQVSRSKPNTPLVYNESSNSSRDPVVSAFPVSATSKSYSSAPNINTYQTFRDITPIGNSSAKRNIMPLLDNLGSIAGPLSDISLTDDLNTLDELSNCHDAFNALAREVASANEFKEL